MAHVSQAVILKIQNRSSQLLRKIHFNPIMCLNHKWREEHKLPDNPNSFGPLTNLPDYSFKDGRPTPYGTHQKERIDAQRDILVKIKKLVGEIDHAVERHEQLKIEKEKQRQNIGVLKPKKIEFFKRPEPKKQL